MNATGAGTLNGLTIFSELDHTRKGKPLPVEQALMQMRGRASAVGREIQTAVRLVRVVSASSAP